jgi:hypothetical protein
MRRSDVTAAAKIESVADARELAERRLPKLDLPAGWLQRQSRWLQPLAG